MTLSPEQIERASFARVKQGYDPDEVDSLLRRLAAQLRNPPDDFERAGEEVASALRGMHHLLMEMKRNAEQEIEESRREAVQERDRLWAEATDDIARLRADANDEAARLRSDAQREHDALVGDAQLTSQRLVDEATELRSEAEQVAHAIDHTVRAKRREVDQYVVSLSARAEELARGRVEEVLSSHRAALSQVAEGRVEAAETLRRAQHLIESALGAVLADLDLTQVEAEARPPAGADNGGVAEDQMHVEALARDIVGDELAEMQAITDAATGPRT